MPELALPDDDLAVDGADQTQRLDRRRKHLARQLGEERHGQELLRILDERRQVAGPVVRPARDRARHPRPRWLERRDLGVEIDGRLPGRELRQRRASWE